jgi:hypothetical protein
MERSALWMLALVVATLGGCQGDDRDGSDGGAGTRSDDDAAAADTAWDAVEAMDAPDTLDANDAAGPLYARCIDVQGPRGCCEYSFTSINHYFENGRVVSRECVGPEQCGYLEIAPGEFGYRCGGMGAPAADFSRCGYSLNSGPICAALGDGPETSPDATFPCGVNGLRCGIGKQYCGLFERIAKAPDADLCVPLPAHCMSPNATCASCEPLQPRPWPFYRCDDVKPGAMMVTPFP